MSVKEYPKGKSKRLSENFNVLEFDCNCEHPECTITKVDDELIQKLQEKRYEWDRAIYIGSGYRCPRYNREVGGARKSQHILGKAADIVVRRWRPAKVAAKCEDFNGLGRYQTFTHVDVRSGRKAKWGRD